MMLAQIIGDGDIVLTQGAGNIGGVVKLLAELQLDIQKMQQVGNE